MAEEEHKLADGVLPRIADALSLIFDTKIYVP